MRYVSQRDRFRCGPIAIANAMKWAGANFSFRDNKKRLDKLCKISETGCNPVNLTRALKKIGHKYLTGIQRRKLSNFTPTQVVRMIRKHIKAGGIVLMNVRRYNYLGQREGHFYLIDGHYVDPKDGEFFMCVNAFAKSPVDDIHEKYLRDGLRCATDETHSIWLLRKRNDNSKR